MIAVRSLTLIEAALPRTRALQNVLLVLAASLLTAAAAQIAILVPWTPVPITGQTFAVLLSGAVLGARRALAAQVMYLAEGASGLPFFAGGAGGAAVFAGPTAGYLIAFPFAAALTGFFAERGWDRRFLGTFAAMLIGSAVIFVFGLAALSRFVPAGQLLGAGLVPFIPGDLIKSLLAAIAFPAVWRLVKRRSGIDA